MKPIVLTFVGCYLPGYRGGGPIRTIANMVERLGDEFDFRIVTMDRDLGDLKPYDSINVDEWNDVGKAKVFYAGPKGRSLRSIFRLLNEIPFDVLYLNGFFNPIFTLRPILARKFGVRPGAPTIVAPRGEFAENALRLKYWKKSLFITLGRVTGLFRGVIWHASTEFEVSDIRRVRRIALSDIRVATNIPGRPEEIAHEISPPQEGNDAFLRVCFLSRIAPMKNLTYALTVLGKVGVKIQFSIYGPKESSSYWDECLALIDRLPENVTAVYKGSVEPAQVKRVIAEHDLFFVPTQGENFGHVFIEAFSAGVPVLVSDRTPWRGLRDQNLGWDVALDRPERFVEALEEMANLGVARRQEIRNSCLDFALRKMESKEILDMNRKLFLNAIGS